MLKSIRNTKGLRLLCAFMALYLLNCSVDCSDIKPLYLAEDLTINDQESIIEIVVENFLGFESAIPENEDTDNESNSMFKKTISVAFYILPHFDLKIKTIDYKSNSKIIGSNKKNVLKPFFKIYSPPPEI